MGIGFTTQVVRQSSGDSIASLDPVTGTVPVDQLPVMQGATPSVPGVAGLVPAPQDAEDDEFLRGDATFTNP